MKTVFKNYTKRLFGINQLENKLNKLKLINETIALQSLQNLLPKSVFIPLTVWSFSPSTILHLVNEIVINNRKNILEFGSGFSTIVISKLIKLNDLKVNFYSVESDNDWFNKVSTSLEMEDTHNFVNLIHSPLKKSSYQFLEHNIWYDPEILNKSLLNYKFDLIIIDGPMGYYKYSRYGAIPFLKNRLSEDFFILCDDTNREEEKRIVEKWNKELNFNQSMLDYYNYSIIKTPGNFDSNPVFYRE